MQTVVGIFPSQTAADNAVVELLENRISNRSLIFLSGEQAAAETQALPTTDTEADGMGKTMGAYVGGVVGAGAGLGLGTAVASLMVPGVGPILAVGIGAAAVLGLAGATAGSTAGDASEKSLDQGVPRDEVFLYRELLKRGRSLIICNLDSDEQAAIAQSVLAQNGAEDIDDVRKELRRAA